MRLWYISHGIYSWITTSEIKAHEFTHSFGCIGFKLSSIPYEGEEIDFIMVSY